MDHWLGFCSRKKRKNSTIFHSNRLFRFSPAGITKQKEKRRGRGEEMKRKASQYWLLKTEPNEWSWESQESNAGVSQWDGVKNRQAVNNLKAMKVSDLCFFYHSGAGPESRRVVGVVEVVKPWYELGDGRGGAVEVKDVGKLKRQVELKEMKEDEKLKGFVMLRQPRLSVVPVDQGVWERICEMGGGYGSHDDGGAGCNDKEEQ